MAVKYTQTFKTYEDAAAEARRAQAMADMLQQQAYQPIQMDTAGPVSYTQGLAKILQSYLAGKEGRKAREAETESKRLGREEFKDYISAFEPERATTPVEMAMAPRSLQQRMELKPQNLDLGQIAQGMGTPTISEQGAMGYTPPTGKLPSAEPMEFTTGTLTSAQRRAKILEGMGSGNPMVQAIAQAEYNKKPEVEEFYQPTETSTGQLVQFGKHGGKRDTGLQAASKAESMTTVGRLMRERDALLPGDPRRATYDKAIAAEGGPKGTTISIDTKGSEVSQKLFLEELANQHKTARSSQGILDRLDRMKAATDAGTFTGATAPGAMAATQWLAGFGVNVAPTTLSNSRTFEAARNQLVLDVMASSGGARGFTENETKILNDSFPKIVDDPKARQAISDVIRAKAKREVDNYNSLLSDYTTTFKDSRIPYKSMQVETKEDRYQRYLRTRGAGPQAAGGVPQ